MKPLIPWMLLCKRPISTVIRNSQYPVCANCVHCIDYKRTDPYDSYRGELSRCALFGEKDLVSGMIKYEYASRCRADDKICGIKGRFYEEQKDPRDRD